jgi:hypothetical protein
MRIMAKRYDDKETQRIHAEKIERDKHSAHGLGGSSHYKKTTRPRN